MEFHFPTNPSRILRIPSFFWHFIEETRRKKEKKRERERERQEELAIFMSSVQMLLKL